MKVSDKALNDMLKLCYKGGRSKASLQAAQIQIQNFRDTFAVAALVSQHNKFKKTENYVSIFDDIIPEKIVEKPTLVSDACATKAASILSKKSHQKKAA
jgi:hypothetical protein